MASISASSQDYLEAILELSQNAHEVRSVDIAAKLKVSRASVNRAIGVLKDAGYVSQERYSNIFLTVAGEMAAREVIKRHFALKNFLIDVLQVCETTAEEDACKMEHHISLETLKKLEYFMEKRDPKI